MVVSLVVFGWIVAIGDCARGVGASLPAGRRCVLVNVWFERPEFREGSISMW